MHSCIHRPVPTTSKKYRSNLNPRLTLKLSGTAGFVVLRALSTCSHVLCCRHQMYHPLALQTSQHQANLTLTGTCRHAHSHAAVLISFEALVLLTLFMHVRMYHMRSADHHHHPRNLTHTEHPSSNVPSFDGSYRPHASIQHMATTHHPAAPDKD